jgi:hypothetical protein
MTIFILGHAGYALTLDRIVPDALLLALNPFQARGWSGEGGWEERGAPGARACSLALALESLAAPTTPA